MEGLVPKVRLEEEKERRHHHEWVLRIEEEEMAQSRGAYFTGTSIQNYFHSSWIDVLSEIGRTRNVFIQNGILKPNEPMRLIDLGGGPWGVALKGIKEKFGNQTETVNVTLGRIIEQPEGVMSIRTDAENLPFEDSSFHMVISNLTLMWVYDPLRAIEEVHRILKVGGRALLHVLSVIPFWIERDEDKSGSTESGLMVRIVSELRSAGYDINFIDPVNDTLEINKKPTDRPLKLTYQLIRSQGQRKYYRKITAPAASSPAKR